MKKISLVSSWLPVIVWAWFIYFLSSIPNLHTNWGLWDFFLRKIAHLTEYGIFTMLVVRAFVRTWPMFGKRAIVAFGFIIPVLYAASDEFHQRFVPGRGPSVGDVVIDACGVAFCLLIFYRGSLRFLFGAHAA